MVPVGHPFDVVVTTNGGYPLDQNLYQSVKGMSAAAQILRDGGAILIATECSDGLPDHGQYRHLLAESRSPEAFLGRLAASMSAIHDQWQVQVQAMIQARATVLVKSDGLTKEQVRGAWFEPVDDVQATLDRLLHEADGGAGVAVLPQGPQTIPFLAA